jgi:hypothetical protein
VKPTTPQGTDQVNALLLFLEEIMRLGHALSPLIPDEPAMAKFPGQPWQSTVNIQVKRFKSPEKMSEPFKNQEIEVGSE